jgi:DNA repair protein RecN (Recombination protein N)
MLVSLRIKNFALIEEVELTLEDGLTVLTGETGAGKSIIVGALGLILGDRAKSGVVRQQAEQAEVEAVFELNSNSPGQQELTDRGLADPDAVLVVRRVISNGGRNRVYINGHLASLTDLREVISPMVDLASQHAHTRLLREGEHLSILDTCGGLADLQQKTRSAFQAWHEANEAFRDLQAKEADRSQRMEYLRFQLQEFEEIKPVPGEEDALTKALQRLRHASTLRSAADQVEEVLTGNRDSVVYHLSQLEKALVEAADADPSLRPLTNRLESARIDLEDVAVEARDYRAGLDVDPGGLEKAEDRMSQLRTLMRRFGPAMDDVIETWSEMQAELERLDSLDVRLERLQDDVTIARSAIDSAARKLTNARKKAGQEMSSTVEEQLAELSMPKTRFVVDFSTLDTPRATGIDQVHFLLSPNVGEEPRPLAQIASGGELCRVMLALKSALLSPGRHTCQVFDEIDSGVSGAVGERIGVKLQQMAMSSQVICITHLPQVACYADIHLRVHKETSMTQENGKSKRTEGAPQTERTITQVTSLDASSRREEIARLLAGIEVTDKAREHAAELLRSAVLSRTKKSA